MVVSAGRRLSQLEAQGAVTHVSPPSHDTVAPFGVRTLRLAHRTPVTPKSRAAGAVDVADLEFRVEETESGDNQATVDVQDDLVPTEVRDDALNAVNKFLDQHEDADVEGAAGETIGKGWVDGESWEVTIYGDAVGEAEDTQLESQA